MADISNINIAQFARDVLPPDERTPENVTALTSFLSAFGWQWTNYISFLNGEDVQLGTPIWTAGTYNKGDRAIQYQSGEVFECLVDGTTSEPKPSTEWKKVLDLFIGMRESQNFWGGSLALTYALNRRFMTNYVDPPGTSDIYIVATPLPVSPFLVGYAEVGSTAVSPTTSTEFVMESYSITPTFSFDIQVPTATMADLGSDAEKIIRTFVDKYITASLNYTITPY